MESINAYNSDLEKRYPSSYFTSFIAKKIRTQTYTINRLLKKHNILIKKDYFYTRQQTEQNCILKSKRLCYIDIEDLDKLLFRMKSTDKPITTQAVISFIIRLQECIYILKNGEVEASDKYQARLKNKIDTATLAAHLGITRRSLLKNKKYTRVIIDGRAYFDFSKVMESIKRKCEVQKIKNLARELLHNKIEEGWGYKELYEYCGFVSDTYYSKYMSQVLVQHQIGHSNAIRAVYALTQKKEELR